MSVTPHCFCSVEVVQNFSSMSSVAEADADDEELVLLLELVVYDLLTLELVAVALLL